MRPCSIALVIITATLGNVGCGSSQAAAAVKIATEAPAGCKELGAVEATAQGSGNEEKTPRPRANGSRLRSPTSVATCWSSTRNETRA
jgi:hypothetical protein